MINILAMLACLYGGLEFRSERPEAVILWSIPFALALVWGALFVKDALTGFEDCD